MQRAAQPGFETIAKILRHNGGVFYNGLYRNAASQWQKMEGYDFACLLLP